jgi:hypothetical protein
MITLRQIERLWNTKRYDRLLAELLVARPEASLRLQTHLRGAVPAAAMVIIWLDEVNQPHVPLYSRLVRTLLAAQESDGGWTDPMITAVCLRALLCCRGEGTAIDRGIRYLSDLQKSEGIWPKVPLRRMPEDPYVSAFILYQLGQEERLRMAIRLDQALHWFSDREEMLDPETRRLWDRAASRCRRSAPPVPLWS